MRRPRAEAARPRCRPRSPGRPTSSPRSGRTASASTPAACRGSSTAGRRGTTSRAGTSPAAGSTSSPSGERFHAALAGVPRPPRSSRGVEPVGDRRPRRLGGEPFDGLDDILAALRPVRRAERLIHGDLTGNVLFHDALPPAIIDFTPYWRPLRVPVRDRRRRRALWEGAPPSSPTRSHPQYLLRALIYRGVTSIVASEPNGAPRSTSLVESRRDARRADDRRARRASPGRTGARSPTRARSTVSRRSSAPTTTSR